MAEGARSGAAPRKDQEGGMKMTCNSHRRYLRRTALPCFITLSLFLTLPRACAATRPAGQGAEEDVPTAFFPLMVGAQRTPPEVEVMPPPPQITRKQRREIQKMRFEKMKKDASELASLADSLKDDVDKSSQDILSLEIVEKAEKIEKLAKRIKASAKGD
jgi:hypothetical protein